MGVPKFFRFISERYPCLNVQLKEYEIPDFDNLYLDMNGIIHVCSHGNDDELSTASEEQIFKDIFYYTELMFRMIQPKKLFMLAVDGVAPRAKMNQQRARRFRTAKDMEDACNKLKINGIKVPEDKFDSNCITPGTEFMARLHEQFKYFLSYKISTDKLWQIPKIVYSGHNVPGEGEHKIMDYIRYLKTSDDWDPNTRHCLHGLDADLIMLGLCTHEPNFSLLREEVQFGKKAKRPKNPEDITFYLLHLSLLRDYIDLEFKSLKTALPFGYDLERIIDDWVLMGFLVGNDFVPNLPTFHIARDSLSVIYGKYIEILPTLGGYLNENGSLNLKRFEQFLVKLSEWDFEMFKETHGFDGVDDDDSPKIIKMRELEKFDMGDDDDDVPKINSELLGMIENTKNLLEADVEDYYSSDDDEDPLKSEYNLNKKLYYETKFEIKPTKEQLLSKAEDYIRAIVWILHYYYNGCPSWSWFYPYHYTPQLSDMKGFSDLAFNFPDDKPFLPFQQLLAVLPAASKKLLPGAFHKLVESVDSPIIDYYPADFETDMNGKQHDWEAIVLIPFINEEKLLNAMEPCLDKLTLEEAERNSHGPMHIFQFTSENLGEYKSPGYFPNIRVNNAKETIVWKDEIYVPQDKLVRGISPKFKDVQPYGFPRLRHIPFMSKLNYEKVKVFSYNSSFLNMILHIKKREISKEMNFIEAKEKEEISETEKTDDESDKLMPQDVRIELAKEDTVDAEKLKEVAEEIVGKEVFVKWPHLVRALVTYVSSSSVKFFRNKDGELEMKELAKDERSMLGMVASALKNTHKSKWGINLSKVEVVVYGKTVEGTKHVFVSNKTKLEYTWSLKSQPFPYQTLVLPNALLPDELDSVETDLETVFKEGSICFFLGHPYFGAKATVMEICPNGIKVKLEIPPDPEFDGIVENDDNNADRFLSGSQISQIVSMNPKLVPRITGAVMFKLKEENVKKNLGLNMKFNKSNQEVIGYTKKMEGKYWKYSTQVAELLKEYRDTFPELFSYLEDKDLEDTYEIEQIYGENSKTKFTEIVEWIQKKQKDGDWRHKQRTIGSMMLSDESIEKMELITNYMRESDNYQTKYVELIVKPADLFIPEPRLSLKCPDPSATYNLLDRIVFVRASHPITLGVRGTIVGWDKKDESGNDAVYDILFDEPVFTDISASKFESRVYRLTKQSFINISHALRNLNPALRPTSLAPAETNWRNKDSLYEKSKNTTGHDKGNAGFSPDNKYNSPKRGWSGGFSTNDNKSSPSYKTQQSPVSESNWRLGQLKVNKDTAVKVESSSLRPDYNNKGTNSSITVNKFFSAYRSPVMPQQPGLQHQTPPLLHSPMIQQIQPFHTAPPQLAYQQAMHQPKPTADSEFQAIWNHLQTQSQQDIKMPATAQPNQSFATDINEQTNALRKLLKLNEGHSTSQPTKQPPILMQPQMPMMAMSPSRKPQINMNEPQQTPCGHKSCCGELISLCQRIGMSYPVYNYVEVKQNKCVSCKLFFPDGLELTGPTCPDKLTAAETVACMGIKYIESNKFQPIQRRPPLLPTPPQQWRQRPSETNREERQDKQQQQIDSYTFVNRKFANPQNNMQIPNSNTMQYQLSKHQEHGNNYQNPISEPKGFVTAAMNRKDIVRPIPQSPPGQSDHPSKPPSKKGMGRGKRRLAANFSTPIDK